MAERDIPPPIDLADEARTRPIDQAEDARARHAVQNPLGTAATPEPSRPRTGALGWGIPAAGVAVVLVLLLIFLL
jgi:hypothetical protein